MKKLFLMLAITGMVGATTATSVAAITKAPVSIEKTDDKEKKKKDEKKACCKKDANGKACTGEAAANKTCSHDANKSCCKGKTASTETKTTETKTADEKK
jgi:hypothetical protein